jgi:nitroimidazol reductase NimA-like FMN-containing flavoprotein (pyridoxamine 5'-phosphate oxidase superfamily)
MNERTAVAPLVDRNGLEILTRAGCLELLGDRGMGRVAVTMNALPVVLPVCYAVLDNDVIIRTGTGTKLSAAVNHSVVTFEVDRLEGDDRWSVCVTGIATPVTRPDDLAKVVGLSMPAGLRTLRPHFVRIRSDMISGRRLWG